MLVGLTLWLVIVALAAAAASPPVVHKSVGSIRVELTLPRTAYATGDPVEARVTARNEGQSPVRLQFRSGQQFDMIIRRRGALVWSWSHDKAFTQAIVERTLGPGQSLTFAATWEQVDLQGRRVDPGEYEATGLFLAQVPDAPGGIETPPLTFRIRG